MFAVLITRNTDEHVQGYLSRYFSEIDPGIYLGITARNIVEQIWAKITKPEILARQHARFILISSDANREQGFEVRRAGEDVGEVIDLDGLLFFARRVVAENRINHL